MTASAQRVHSANRFRGRTCHPELVEGSHLLSRALKIPSASSGQALRLCTASLSMTRKRVHQMITSQKQIIAPATAKAFTLIEMLVVIAIIAVLAALLLPSISKVQKHAKKVKATAEVAQIAAAWQQYYSEYQRWPSIVTTEDPMPLVGELAEVLYRGDNDTGDNPRRLRFMDFKNYSSETNPITPWADPDVLEPAGASDPDAQYFYWVMFDRDYNNEISGSAVTPEIDDPLTNDVRRTVIVWAVNPDVAEGMDEGDPDFSELYIIGSWE